MKPMHRLAALACAATLIACSETVAPTNQSASVVQITGNGGGTDTLIPTGYTGTARIGGRVLSTARKPGATGNDTLSYDGIAGAKVTLKRNLLVNGAATQVTLGITTTDAQGNYAFTNAPGGYYVVYASGPAGGGWSDSYTLTLADRPLVTSNIYLWKQ
jgi:hypothetical protein